MYLNGIKVKECHTTQESSLADIRKFSWGDWLPYSISNMSSSFKFRIECRCSSQMASLQSVGQLTGNFSQMAVRACARTGWPSAYSDGHSAYSWLETISYIKVIRTKYGLIEKIPEPNGKYRPRNECDNRPWYSERVIWFQICNVCYWRCHSASTTKFVGGTSTKPNFKLQGVWEWRCSIGNRRDSKRCLFWVNYV